MKAKIPIYVLAVVLAIVHFGEAQQPKKIPRIGWLAAGAGRTASSRIEAFRQGLHELGYAEGKNIVIEYRYAEGNLDRLPALAADLVRLKVDIIVTTTGQSVLAVKNATQTIPIVFAGILDPVASGIIDTLARPGGNATGLSILGPELGGKRLELLKEVVPGIVRVAYLWGSGSQAAASTEKETQAAARGLG